MNTNRPDGLIPPDAAKRILDKPSYLSDALWPRGLSNRASQVYGEESAGEAQYRRAKPLAVYGEDDSSNLTELEESTGIPYSNLTSERMEAIRAENEKYLAIAQRHYPRLVAEGPDGWPGHVRS